MNNTMPVPCYPDFVPMSFELKNSLHPRLALTADGVSEFTFTIIYLYRNQYHFRVSRDGPNGGFIISGDMQGKKFFMTPCEAPHRDVLKSLFDTHDFWEAIPESMLESSQDQLAQWGMTVSEDRDNFDYLYFRSDMAELAGKKFHKKKNLVNQFLHMYAYEQRPLTRELIPLAMDILEHWHQNKNGENDYGEAKEALGLFDSLPLRGFIYFVDGKPAAYCLGEGIAKGKMFAIHFEKAIDHYKGIYQFINQTFAASLPRFFIYINREQDAGDKGLRQAKMTYRPAGFVKKYTARR